MSENDEPHYATAELAERLGIPLLEFAELFGAG